MRVLLVGNYVPDDQASMLAFRSILERELPAMGCELRVVAPEQRMLSLSPSSRWSKWLAYIDKFVLFIPSLKSHARWADVIHVCDHSNAMYVQWLGGKPNVVTCHDVIAIEAGLGMVDGWNVGWSGRMFQRWIARGLGRADLVACVSHLTERSLLALRLADPRKVTTVANGLNGDFHPVPIDEAVVPLGRLGLSAQDKYLIHVGSDLPRKNRMAVIQAFVALQERAASVGTTAPAQHLVLVGPELTPDQLALARQHGVADRIKTAQNVSHAELRALYSSAVAMVFPSLLEGFGWPVIEAQACGCPVFTSDLAPMNEIGGKGAIYVDPKAAEAMAVAIEQAQPQWAQMRAMGLENAALYSTEKMVTSYHATYRRVLAEHAEQQG